MSATITQNKTTEGAGLQFHIKVLNASGDVDTDYDNASLLLGSRNVDDKFMLSDRNIKLSMGEAPYNVSADDVARIWDSTPYENILVNMSVTCTGTDAAGTALSASTTKIKDSDGAETNNLIKPMSAPFDLRMLTALSKDAGASLTFSVKTSNEDLETDSAGLVKIQLVIGNDAFNPAAPATSQSANIQSRSVLSEDTPVGTLDPLTGVTTWTFAADTGILPAKLINYLEYEIVASVNSKVIKDENDRLASSTQSNGLTVTPSPIPAAPTNVEINTIKADGVYTPGTTPPVDDDVVSYDCKFEDPDANAGSSNVLVVGISDDAGGMKNSPRLTTSPFSAATNTAAATAPTSLPTVSIPFSWFGTTNTSISLISRVVQTRSAADGGGSEPGALSAVAEAYKIVTPDISVKITEITDAGVQSFEWFGSYGNEEKKDTNSVSLTINGVAQTGAGGTVLISLTSNTSNSYTAKADVPYSTGEGHAVVATFTQQDANGTMDGTAVKVWEKDIGTDFYKVKTMTALVPTLTASGKASVAPYWASSINLNGYATPTYTGNIGALPVNSSAGIPPIDGVAPGVPGNYKLIMKATSALVTTGRPVYVTFVSTAAADKQPTNYVDGTSPAEGVLYYTQPTITTVTVSGKEVTINGSTHGANVTNVHAVGFHDSAHGKVGQVATLAVTPPSASAPGSVSNFSFEHKVTFTEDVVINPGTYVGDSNNSTFDLLAFLTVSNAAAPFEVVNDLS